MQKVYKSKKRGNLIKLVNNYILSIFEKHAKKIITKMQFNFNNNIKEIYYQSDKVKLKAIEFLLISYKKLGYIFYIFCIYFVYIFKKFTVFIRN